MKEIKILEDIILSESSERATLVGQFQNLVWRERGRCYGTNEEIDEILSNLAYDLDFYEPNETWREESPSYYGDERLEQEVRSALQKLEQYSRSE